MDPRVKPEDDRLRDFRDRLEKQAREAGYITRGTERLAW
jgi:hypothetical protein